MTDPGLSRGSAPDRRGMEIELGGYGLVMLGAAIVALCAASFWLGRSSARLVPGSSAAAPDQVADLGDVEKDLSFFDRLEKAPEIQAIPPAAPAPAASRAEAPPATGHEVQVFASSDRQAADALVQKLRAQGLKVRLLAAAPGEPTLYRVRAYGYADEAAARQAAATLQRQQGLKTWVVH
jgi:sporulation related protein